MAEAKLESNFSQSVRCAPVLIANVWMQNYTRCMFLCQCASNRFFANKLRAMHRRHICIQLCLDEQCTVT